MMSDFVYSQPGQNLAAAPHRPGALDGVAVFTFAQVSDGSREAMLRGLEFLRTPVQRVTVPPVGHSIGVPSIQGSVQQQQRVAPTSGGGPPPAGAKREPKPPPRAAAIVSQQQAQYPRLQPQQSPPQRQQLEYSAPSPARVTGNNDGNAQLSMPLRANNGVNNNGNWPSPDRDDFEVDDDDFFDHIDVDQMVQQRHHASQPAPQPVPSRQPQHPPPQARLEQPAQVPPLDGADLDWQCEHGCALRSCPKLMLHVAEVKKNVEFFTYQLEDEDVVMSNKERNSMLKQKQHALEILRFAEGGDGGGMGGGGGAARDRGMGAHGGDFVSASSMSMAPQQWNGSSSQATRMNLGGGMGATGGGGPAAPLMVGGAPPGPGSRWPPENADKENGDFTTNRQTFDAGPSIGGFQRDTSGDMCAWDNRPAPGDAAALIPSVDCQFLDDGINKWTKEGFEWSPRIRQVLVNTFNAQDFRGMQLATINCTMANQDCLVLMPTGGGKSLCYQLPAVVSPGITVVISPLISLIQDQLFHLSEMGIPAAVLGSAENEGQAQQDHTYGQLYSHPPGLKLLYLTPEKVARSGKLMSALEALHRRGMLSRVVIDEVHCISNWGHDFRKDYKALRILKDRFPTVPVIGLTATATKRVQKDCATQLGLGRCWRFFQTFNRTNIMYSVVKKSKKTVDDILDIIAKKYVRRNGRVDCGIIYCFSQAECEKMALDLQIRPGKDKRFPKGLKALPYHAGLNEQRERNQREWSAGGCSIICATVAFGMGINKPDVRFVFHYSMPKSLEAYHQESGRAGRDGAQSECTLFYTYSDAQKARRMIQESAKQDGAPQAVLEANLDALNSLVSYAENEKECRRTLLLRHFNEQFDRNKCRLNCDTCRAMKDGAVFEDKDMTPQATAAAEVVSQLGQKGGSMTLIIDIFRGSQKAIIKRDRLDRLKGYGAGKSMKLGDVERLLRWMVMKNYLYESSTRQETGGMYSAIITTVHANGRKCEELASGRARVMLPFKVDAKTAAYHRGEEKQRNTRGAVPTTAAGPPRGNAAAGRTAPVAGASTSRFDAKDDIDELCYGVSGADGFNVVGGGPITAAPEVGEGDGADDERYDALYEALLEMRSQIATEIANKKGAYMPVHNVARPAILDSLARNPPESLETMMNHKYKDSSEGVFIRNHGPRVWATIQATLAALHGEGKGVANLDFGVFEFQGTQAPGGAGGDGEAGGVKRVASRGPGEAMEPQWQRARRAE